MTQRDRDRLVVLKKAQKKLITQKQAAAELDISERQVRRLLKALAAHGDKAVRHGLRGRASNRKLSEEVRQKIVTILSHPDWRGFGPTLASHHLSRRHQIHIGREALRQLMMAAGLWRSKQQKIEQVHTWRPRRSCRGELVQWDTSEHDWLEGRGPKLYLIAMIDDATGELTARLAPHDSTEENMRLLWTYLQNHGRPVAFYTDKASLFQTAAKVKRDQKELPRQERQPAAPTQIGRALRELQIVWIAAHSPQAKGRIERAFATLQDRLVKGMRLERIATLEQANQYLQQQFLPWWNETQTVIPAHAADAHRPLGPDHDLASVLSRVETRQISSDYTFQHGGKLYPIPRNQIRTGMRGGAVRIELRLEGTMAVCYDNVSLQVSECEQRPKVPPARLPSASATRKTTGQRTAAWRASNNDLYKPGPSIYAAAAPNRTRTRDSFD